MTRRKGIGYRDLHTKAVDYQPYIEFGGRSGPFSIVSVNKSIGSWKIIYHLESGHDKNWVLSFMTRQRADNDELLKRFSDSAKKWKEQTALYSSSIQMYGNDNYLDIIGMGPKVIPHILNDLKKEENHWFRALQAITGQNPVPVNDFGDIEKMSQHWISWGEKNGFI